MIYKDIMSWDDNKLKEMLELNNRKLRAYRALLIDVDSTEKEEEYKREMEKIKSVINLIKIEQGRRLLSKNWNMTIDNQNNSVSSNMEDDI